MDRQVGVDGKEGFILDLLSTVPQADDLPWLLPCEIWAWGWAQAQAHCFLPGISSLYRLLRLIYRPVSTLIDALRGSLSCLKPLSGVLPLPGEW